VACGLTFAACITAMATLTRGFEHWTFEDLRLAAVQRGELRAPPTPARTSRGETIVLFAGGDTPTLFLVDFIYTRCPGVCRALGNEYQQIQKALDAAPSPGVQLVSLSFDLAHDGSAELAAYATLQRARADRWAVAVPLTPAANRKLLQQLLVVAIDDGSGGYVHNGDIHLIDGAGQVHGVYTFDRWPDALAAARRLAMASP
jgi:protein SCO1/2